MYYRVLIIVYRWGTDKCQMKNTPVTQQVTLGKTSKGDLQGECVLKYKIC